jgi:peptide/nickel transport system substrate-binding protein
LKEEKPDNKDKGQLTRREFLKNTGWVLGGATLGSMAFLNACKTGATVTLPAQTITTTATQTSTATATATATSTQTITATATSTATTTATSTVTASPTTRVLRTLRIDGDNMGFPQPYTGSTQGRAYLYMSMIFDTLTWKDQTGVVPLLAKSWTTSTDNKIWTFTLASNVKFSDGSALTADDVKFSFDYIKAHPNQWVQLGMVQSVAVVNPTTVQITLNAPYAPMLTDVAALVPIMPQKLWSAVADPTKFTTSDAFIGSGPFKLNSFDATTGTYIYDANMNYFMGPPVVDRLIYSPNSNANQSLLTGNLDAAQNLTYDQAMALKTNFNFRELEGPGLFIVRLYFSFDIPEFNNPVIRQAIYTAINRPEIVQKALSNGGTVGNPGYVSPDSIWYNPAVTQYAYDPAKARQMLDNLSIYDYSGDAIREYAGKPMQYEMVTASTRLNEAQLIVNYLAAIGIKVTIKTVTQATLNSLIQAGVFQIALNGHGSMGGDPVMLANFTSPSVTLGTTPLVTRQGGTPWSNSQFDTVFVQQLSEMVQASRISEVNQLQQILSDQLPTLPIYYNKITIGWNPATLNGWFFTSGGTGPSVPTAQNKLVFVRGSWGQ